VQLESATLQRKDYNVALEFLDMTPATAAATAYKVNVVSERAYLLPHVLESARLVTRRRANQQVRRPNLA
jgi:hypothetical protein